MLMLTRRMQKDEAKAKAVAVLGGGATPVPLTVVHSMTPRPTKKAATNKFDGGSSGNAPASVCTGSV